MGALVWHDWARLLALASGAYVAWAALWGFMDRKYFWDFVGGSLGPHGIVPPPAANVFVQLIVDVPVFQIVNLVNGLLTIALEWPPIPKIKDLKLYRSYWLRIAFYVWAALVASFVYQTVMGTIFYLITTLAYVNSLRLGEQIVPTRKSVLLSNKL
ncbi:hypothetical protein C6P46_005539 [Rhodotorula mucilaginosa]|uniref:DUF7727 domain-containing protein n=1 Tax=Rhodotorula mucilaginosa TaxID=5537 RepID=A0A9P6VYR5_RHOMI|nr:hypothetical protein C6P46_005539 [Rhodotorula mucilaginosa]TKA56604.1 hypothetical protein B0A53_01796 [Rhodotorula sp. CCFEE 5036]